MAKQLAVGSFDHVVYQAEKKLTVTKDKLSFLTFLVTLFSAQDKSDDTRANSQLLEQM